MKTSDGGLQILGTGDELAVEAAGQEIAGAERGAALVDRLDEEGFAVRQARADMAAIAQYAEVVEEERRRRDLLAQPQCHGVFVGGARGLHGRPF